MMTQRVLFEYLLNTLWQVPLLAAATWLVIRVVRPAIALQHALWIVALLLGVLLPLRGIHAESPQQAATIVLYPEPAPKPTLAEELAEELRAPTLQLSDAAISRLLQLYGVSVAFSLVRLIHGYVAARRLATQAVEHPLTTLETSLIRACASRLSLDAERIPAIRFLADPAASPFVIGIRNPVLLLPESLRPASATFSDVDLAAVLSHELAHIRRRDFLANLLARAIALPIAYHPATGALHSRIRQTREMICDHHAACSFDSPTIYARSLLAVADRLIQPTRHVEAVGLFDSTTSKPARSLEERIVKLTQPALSRSILHTAARITAGTAILTAGLVGASTIHITSAAPAAPQSVYSAQQPVYAAMLQEPAAPQAPQAVTSPQQASAPVAAPAPTPAPAPVPAPAPEAVSAPSPAPRVIAIPRVPNPPPYIVIDDAQVMPRDLTIQLDKLSTLNSPEFKKQMEVIKLQIDSPEFRKQIEEAKAAATKGVIDTVELKRQVELAQQQINSPEVRAQIEAAKQMTWKAQLDNRRQMEDARKELAEARAQIKEARKTATDPKLQKQLDDAGKHLDAATRTF